MAKRIFVAAEICEVLRQDIYSHSVRLFSGCKNIRIVPEENLHITLKFIGNTGEEQVREINETVKKAVSRHKHIYYTLKPGMGAFPRTDRARIAYMAIQEGYKAFCDLFLSLEGGLAGLGLKREKRRFYPHITTARLKKPLDISKMADMPFKAGEWAYRCSHISVYESILDSRGARYMIIERFVLK